MSATRICRDVTCPSCGFPETYAEVDLDDLVPGADAFGCNKCGWRQDAPRPATDEELHAEAMEAKWEHDNDRAEDARQRAMGGGDL